MSAYQFYNQKKILKGPGTYCIEEARVFLNPKFYYQEMALSSSGETRQSLEAIFKIFKIEMSSWAQWLTPKWKETIEGSPEHHRCQALRGLLSGNLVAQAASPGTVEVGSPLSQFG